MLFNHEKIRFELWLLGQNKVIQKQYWHILKESDWKKYALSKNAQESIIEYVLIEKPDFNQLDILTEKIKNGTLKFIKDISVVFKVIKK